ncbi:MAG: hypothetical protein RJQ09_04145 [Cyclobacteriaceae bacterium]
MQKLTPLILSFLIVTSCSPQKETAVDTSSEAIEIEDNPPAEGFNIEGSDPQAIKIADDVMTAMGGRKAWDNLRGISWNFFDYRKLYWDKWTGNVRVEYLKEDREAIVNINSGEGKVLMNGAEVSNPDSLAKYLDQAKSAWINDAYWLVMPFKLKDSGVTLQFIDSDTTMDGKDAYLLSLKFKDVGVTPDNYYEIWVDSESKLISQWAYYQSIENDTPRFTMPWKSYKDFKGVKLSGDRGERQITEIKVYESFPETFFTDFSPVNI